MLSSYHYLGLSVSFKIYPLFGIQGFQQKEKTIFCLLNIHSISNSEEL